MFAVEYYLTEDISQEQVCRIFKYSLRSLMRWIEKYDEECVIKRHNRQPVEFDGEDMTDLFENNFNSVKRYHDRMAISNIESKRISDMCNVDIVREMFK